MSNKSFLADWAVVRSPAARMLFMASALVTIAIVLWTQHLRRLGYVPTFTPIYYMLFDISDYGGAIVALLVLLGAVLIPESLPIRPVVRWVGTHPVIVAGLSAI